MTGGSTESFASKTVITHAVIRACAACGHTRSVDMPCAGCGLTDPPRVDYTGVVSATYRNPVKQLAWNLVGVRLAARRIKRLNRAACAHR